MSEGTNPHRGGIEVRAEGGLQRTDLWGQEGVERGGRASICRPPFSPSLAQTAVSSRADQGLFPDWRRGEQVARHQLPEAHHREAGWKWSPGVGHRCDHHQSRLSWGYRELPQGEGVMEALQWGRKRGRSDGKRLKS